MKEIILKKLLINEDVEILGHVFHGLREISAAVELSVFHSDIINPGMMRLRTPELVIPGIHVAEVWQSYPCFDSEDSMYENRTYQNYFFSDKPFSPSKLSDIISRCTCRYNYQLVNCGMPANFAPALYYVGDGLEMELAITE